MMFEISQLAASAGFRAIIVQKGVRMRGVGGAATVVVNKSFLPRCRCVPTCSPAGLFWWLHRCVVVIASRLSRRQERERGDYELS